MTNQFSARGLFSRATKITGALAFSLLTVSLVACGEPELDEVDADADVPSEQAAVPADAEVGDGTIDVSELLGETVTVSTKVTEVLSPNMFTVYDAESMRGEEVLVVTSLPAPEVGQNVELTGEVKEMDAAAVESAYSIVLEDAVKEAYTGKPYIDALALEAVD